MIHFWTLFLSLVLGICAEDYNSPWTWECRSYKCVKIPIEENMSNPLSLAQCKLFCGDGGLWPLPTGEVRVIMTTSKIDPTKITLKDTSEIINAGKIKEVLEKVVERFISQLEKRVAKQAVLYEGGKRLSIAVEIEDLENLSLSLSTDESYTLKIEEQGEDVVSATITAPTYFGARHGIETLSQLVVFDDIRQELQIANNVDISDSPVYPYRGILLDTARNYFSVESIKRTIDAMGSSKLNTFHWHITDSQSFPFQSKSRPELTKKGAYKPHLIYTVEDIQQIVEYALIRGVRVLPEFDAPAHVGEGWQDHLDVITCFKYKPYIKYCAEPPCGQLDPSKPEVYDILEDIYADMFEVFQPDIFHMGGDEVKLPCWNSSTELQTWMQEKGWGLSEADFMKLWGYFQDKALEKVYKVAGKEITIILWTSQLTDIPYITNYLPKEKYIIQIWTRKRDHRIHDILSQGYKVILSNYDAWYLDCGFSSWTGEGHNWCSPYKEWQKVYDNNLKKIAREYSDQVLGGEATLWTEQTDELSLDDRIWPRGAALAERLWSEPEHGWADAKYRLSIHRERLVEQGIAAESLEPEWCIQNEGDCP